MDNEQLDELLGLKPKYDIPPAARRALVRIGVIAKPEGGFASQALAGQPAALVVAAIKGTKGPLVSRWAHILLRRTLASRLNPPRGVDPVDFAAMRAALLNRIGESDIARALVQDVDSSEYDLALTNAAFDAYLASGDLMGMCPVAQLQPTIRNDGEWLLTRAVCEAYSGDTRDAQKRIGRILNSGKVPEIDVRLAQRYAGAAGKAEQAVNIEWGKVRTLDLWRYSLSRALGEDLPEKLRSGAPWTYDADDATMPEVPILQRVAAAPVAAGHGVLSAAAMVSLYSQLYSNDAVDATNKQEAQTLREAYVATDPAARLAAMQQLWGKGGYGERVLTAYAAARLPASKQLAASAGDIIGSMLTAGLDRNAALWAPVVAPGSEGWALLALARPADPAIDSRDVGKFIDNDTSTDKRKSRFLVAGLAGLGRLDAAKTKDYTDRLKIDLDRSSPWSQRIDMAGKYRLPALVALLTGLGMQGRNWDGMTARELFHIVRALKESGLEPDARMIAAEAVFRA